MSLSPIEIADRFYKALEHGQMDEILSLISDDIYLREADSLPFGGEYVGKDAFSRLVDRLMGEWEGYSFKINELLDAGSRVIAMSTAHGFWRPLQKCVEIEVAEFLTIRDGKIEKIVPFYFDTGALVDRSVGA